ncbi:hypothetical protein [Modestobacter versicolor]|uniref:hypothetical protein n=1 Tax=Modestobacter versicolor TaxID=429133 RepID=UPI0034DEB1BB
MPRPRPAAHPRRSALAVLLTVLALSACSAPAVVADAGPAVPAVVAGAPADGGARPDVPGPGSPAAPAGSPAGSTTSTAPAAGDPVAGDPTTTSAADPSGPADPASPAAPAGAAPAADPATDPPPPVADGAVWCPYVALAVTAPQDGGSVPAGRTTVTGTSGDLQGRKLTWTVTGATGTTTGTATRTSAGTFSFPVDLTAGTARVTVAVQAPVPPAATSWLTCRQVSTELTVRAATWASGAAGDGVADGRFATWRGSPVPVAGTWVDDNVSQVELWTIQPKAEFGRWTGDLDIAIGAIGEGETWADAARGAYDARWTRSLQEMARLWAGHPGTLYVRFAHEFNGDWYPWQVTAATAADFRASWVRFRALQQRWFPSSQLVFCPNSDTQGANGLDWRTAFPGAGHVDVVAVDYYNMWPWVGTAAEFQKAALAYDRWGAPRGIQRHLEFARSVGLPFAVSEWGNNADFGDSPAFMEQMHAFFAANAGTGPGQLRYEVLFNEVWPGSNPYALTPTATAPLAAAAYRQLF